MTRRIGIAVGTEMVSAVVARGREVVWTAVAPVDDGDVAAAVDGVIQRLPRVLRPLWPAPRVRVAVDDVWGQVKLVRGLPPVGNPRALGQVIAAAPQRFFISPNGALVSTGVRVVAPGAARTAALCRSVVDAVCQGCARRRVTVAAVVPAAVALEGLSAEERGHPLAMALGAALLDRREPVVHRPGRREAPRVQRRRVVMAGALGALLVAGVVVVPPVLASRSEAAARRTVGALARRRAAALATKRELDGVTRSIAAVATFEQSRLSVTLLLAQLADALPAGSAITTLRCDTLGITLVTLAPHAADVVRAVGEMPGVTHVELVGPVTREVMNQTMPQGVTATELEQVTVRFHLLPDPTAARRPLEAESEGERVRHRSSDHA